MADEIISRDANRVTVLAGVNASGEIRMAAVDGVTGYLLMRINASAGPAAQVQPLAQRDQNRVRTWIAEKADGTLQCALADSDGNLFIATA